MRSSHVKSDNVHPIIQHTHLSPYTWHLRLPRFSAVEPILQFIPIAHVTASLPSPGDNHQSTGGLFERTQGQAKMAAWNSFSYICTRALHSFTHFRALSRESEWKWYNNISHDEVRRHDKLLRWIVGTERRRIVQHSSHVGALCRHQHQ